MKLSNRFILVLAISQALFSCTGKDVKKDEALSINNVKDQIVKNSKKQIPKSDPKSIEIYKNNNLYAINIKESQGWMKLECGDDDSVKAPFGAKFLLPSLADGVDKTSGVISFEGAAGMELALLEISGPNIIVKNSKNENFQNILESILHESGLTGAEIINIIIGRPLINDKYAIIFNSSVLNSSTAQAQMITESIKSDLFEVEYSSQKIYGPGKVQIPKSTDIKITTKKKCNIKVKWQEVKFE